MRPGPGRPVTERAYNKALSIEQRTIMMQAWTDFLEEADHGDPQSQVERFVRRRQTTTTFHRSGKRPLHQIQRDRKNTTRKRQMMTEPNPRARENKTVPSRSPPTLHLNEHIPAALPGSLDDGQSRALDSDQGPDPFRGRCGDVCAPLLQPAGYLLPVPSPQPSTPGLQPRHGATRPVWGAILDDVDGAIRGGEFQSTRPVWARREYHQMMCQSAVVSIHAPRVGRDTVSSGQRSQLPQISIHAPRVRRDGFKIT
jgi:hypothetical protein